MIFINDDPGLEGDGSAATMREGGNQDCIGSLMDILCETDASGLLMDLPCTLWT